MIRRYGGSRNAVADGSRRANTLPYLAVLFVVCGKRFGIGKEDLCMALRNNHRRLVPAGWVMLALSVTAQAEISEAVGGSGPEFVSTRDTAESCIALAHMPDAVYSESDRQWEQRFCEIDFYAANTAVCPKTWSTSPAMLVYDIAQTPFEDNASGFERDICPRGGSARKSARRELAIYKVSMNAVDTSATYSKSSLLYYHFSRYLQSRVGVPVAVYRSMDRVVHRERVVEPGIRLTADRGELKMIHAGWSHLRDADSDPGAYRLRAEVITPDAARVYGVLLLEAGRRYGAALNGTRASGWGVGQSRDFQRTAPFIALRSAGTLAEAIDAGIAEARAEPEMARALKGAVAPAQVAFWMQELTEVVLLDYLFNQQDRIGNIDYQFLWHWWQDGQFMTRLAPEPSVPADIAAYAPLRLKRSRINDNDAGGRSTYVNYAEKTGMLDGLRHFNPDLYGRIARLSRDFAEQGELFQFTARNFGLSDKYLVHLSRQVSKAFAILSEECASGELRFDLDPELFIRDGEVAATSVDCESGKKLDTMQNEN